MCGNLSGNRFLVTKNHDTWVSPQGILRSATKSWFLEVAAQSYFPWKGRPSSIYWSRLRSGSDEWRSPIGQTQSLRRDHAHLKCDQREQWKPMISSDFAALRTVSAVIESHYCPLYLNILLIRFEAGHLRYLVWVIYRSSSKARSRKLGEIVSGFSSAVTLTS